MGERKFRDVLLKIWSIFLASTGVTERNLHIEFVCGLRGMSTWQPSKAKREYCQAPG